MRYHDEWVWTDYTGNHLLLDDEDDEDDSGLNAV